MRSPVVCRCRGRRPRRPAEGSTLGGAQRAPPVCYANPLVRLFAPQGQTLLTPRFRSAQPWPLFATPQPLPPMQRIRSGNGEVEGRACPAPTGWRKKVADERGKGGRQYAPSQWAEVDRERVVTHSPSESPRPLTRPAPFDKGAFFLRGRSPRGEPPHQGRWPRSRPEGFRKLAGGCPLMRSHGQLRAAYIMPPLQSSCYRHRGFGGTPDSKVEEGPMALRTDSNTASV